MMCSVTENIYLTETLNEAWLLRFNLVFRACVCFLCVVEATAGRRVEEGGDALFTLNKAEV